MRILIAEDEKQLAEALCEILIYNKYSVDIVADGEEAIEYIEAIEYDGIIMDIMMPKVDGISVLKKMRKEKNTTPVLLLTAKSEIEDKIVGLDSGADDYVTKPFVAEELLARLRAITRRKKENMEATIVVGNITLDCSTYELSSEKGKCVLTNKEYQLMEMLFQNVGRYISSEQFLLKIWGYESEINVVWAHLSALRKKLATLDATIKIKSSRNLGYTLEVING